ncbi:phosphate ABC transporter permease PstA [Pelolinea submarina]|uniref:Phosphate transport system permease protein PstA n=1 Tax=Pelolinea submarina TaxID=913107 RepID=A0A347ZRZ8_9CHLR|nr:phosphate ABC transporter permease PstA [Pelolinea submarina]REG11356.1 phosphate ABC transporter membrane protein 2 (PhoT family) [Pelolinea submarina]BBB48079.1 phosphate transport system permease protein [Pelolinea submarina]
MIKDISLARKQTRVIDPAKNLHQRQLKQRIAFALIWLAGIIAITALLFIVGYMVSNGFKVINLEFLTTRPAGGVSGKGGISTTIVTTIYLVLLTITIAAPLGIGTAVFMVEYTTEYAGKKNLVGYLINLIRTSVEILAGVPSIIFGLFGFAVFVSYMKLKFSLLSAGLSGACLVLPLIIRTTEEALLTVPKSYREGSLALGTTKWQMIFGVVLPSALPGIITGIVLSVGRVIAETAVFWVTLGGSYRLPKNLLSSGRTMALHVYMLASETTAFDKALGTSAILIVIIILLNLAINISSKQFSKKFSGK